MTTIGEFIEAIKKLFAIIMEFIGLIQKKDEEEPAEPEEGAGA